MQSDRLEIETSAQVDRGDNVLKRGHDAARIVDLVRRGRGRCDTVDLVGLSVLLRRRRSQLSTRGARVAEAARCDELEWC